MNNFVNLIHPPVYAGEILQAYVSMIAHELIPEGAIHRVNDVGAKPTSTTCLYVNFNTKEQQEEFHAAVMPYQVACWSGKIA